MQMTETPLRRPLFLSKSYSISISTAHKTYVTLTSDRRRYQYGGSLFNPSPSSMAFHANSSPWMPLKSWKPRCIHHPPTPSTCKCQSLLILSLPPYWSANVFPHPPLLFIVLPRDLFAFSCPTADKYLSGQIFWQEDAKDFQIGALSSRRQSVAPGALIVPIWRPKTHPTTGCWHLRLYLLLSFKNQSRQ